MLAAISTLVLQAAGCTNGPAARGTTQLDSAKLAAREVRRTEFLAEQQALRDSSLRAAQRDRPFLAEVVIEHPTMVAFFPATAIEHDSVALRQRMRRFQDVAAFSGCAFEQRYSEDLRIIDRRSNALYVAPLPQDSIGVVLIAPGGRPQVWFGDRPESTLRDGIGAYLSALRGRGGGVSTGT